MSSSSALAITEHEHLFTTNQQVASTRVMLRVALCVSNPLFAYERYISAMEIGVPTTPSSPRALSP